MKHGSNKKKFIVICVCMFLLLTAFFDWNLPNLINADKPFIDLSGSVGDSIGNAKAAYEKSILTPVPDENPVPTITLQPTNVPDVTNPVVSEVIIKVGEERLSGSGEMIFIDEVPVESVEALIQIISKEEYNGKSFVIWDYYAETESYRTVIKVLQGLDKTYRLDSVKDLDS